MIFENCPIDAKFVPHIEAVFHYKNFQPDHSVERVVPTGHVFILFELDGFERHTFDNQTLQPNGSYSKVWISGMRKNYLSISAHQDSEMLVIQFKPGGAYPYFHFPINELNDRVVDTQTFFGDSLVNLQKRLLQGSDSTEKFNFVFDWLKGQFDPMHKPPENLIRLIEELQTTTGTQCKKLVEKYQHTHKHVIEQFKKYVGLTPKVFQRILRFNEVLTYLQNDNSASWSAIAQHCGYTDQSHFIREFNNFSGFNPQQFINEAFDQQEPNFFPLDRNG